MLLSFIVPVGPSDVSSILPHLCSTAGQAECRTTELIFVIDGPEAARKLGEWDVEQWPANVTLAATRRNGGPGTARNIGLSIAQGEYVSFVDADDAWNPLAFGIAAEAAHSRQLDLVIGVATRHGVSTRPAITRRVFASLLPTPERSFADQVGIWRLCIRRDFIVRKGLGFVDQRYGEDLIFVLRLLAEEPSSSMLDVELYDYRPTGKGLASQPSRADMVEAARQVRQVVRRARRFPLRSLSFSWLIRLKARRLRRSKNSRGISTKAEQDW